MSGSTPRLRQLGAVLILIAGLMLLLGQTLFRNRLYGKWYVLYWFGCLACTTLSMLISLRDFRALRRELRQEQLNLFEDNLAGFLSTSTRPPNQPPPAASQKSTTARSPTDPQKAQN
jgi:hypothetical protein